VAVEDRCLLVEEAVVGVAPLVEVAAAEVVEEHRQLAGVERTPSGIHHRTPHRQHIDSDPFRIRTRTGSAACMRAIRWHRHSLEPAVRILAACRIPYYSSDCSLSSPV